jgi:hypothetical protein
MALPNRHLFDLQHRRACFIRALRCDHGPWSASSSLRRESLVTLHSRTCPDLLDDLTPHPFLGSVELKKRDLLDPFRIFLVLSNWLRQLKPTAIPSPPRLSSSHDLRNLLAQARPHQLGSQFALRSGRLQRSPRGSRSIWSKRSRVARMTKGREISYL